MRNSTLSYLPFLAMLLLHPFVLFAQPKQEQNPTAFHRCFTMEYLENQIKADPTLPAKWKAQGELIQQENAKKKVQGTQSKLLNLQNVTVIPIVFHVVVNAGQQATITDALLQRQVDVLNRDFAGLNPDSSKLPAAFKAVFGHSKIRFCLAKRTPGNIATNGIERRVTNATFTQNTLSNLKKTAAGGLDAWDGNKYFNVWLATFTDGLLGIATFPFSAPPDEQGVAIHWGTIDLACGSPFPNAYDLGRTLVHETGHYFYLWHIWGDDADDCSGNDFRIQAGYPLTATCNDDTPNQTGSTGGCLSGVQTDACSPVAPGFMYQNYMDYTDDACYGMFTIAQTCRMESCLEDFRASLKTSNGCTPVVAVNNDVRISEVLSPSSRGFACGAKATICTGPLSPQVLIVNDADLPLTSVKLTIQIDGNTVAVQNWTGNVAAGDFTFVNINSIVSPEGIHTLTVIASEPNGVVDEKPNNNTVDAKYELLSVGLDLPLASESFEGAFPPAGWKVINPDNGITWAKTLLAGNPGVASARINSYNYSTKGRIDYLVAPKIKTTGADSVIVKFNLAYAKYSNSPQDWEELELVYSEDCGLTWLPTGYRKSGNDLATNGGVITGDVSFVPTLAQWRKESVALPTCQLSASEILVAFKSTNQYGNNIYIDNVSIEKVDISNPNTGISDLTSPVDFLCSNSFEPQLVLTNKGSDPLTSIKFNIVIDGAAPVTYNWTGNISRCSSVVVNTPTITTTGGVHSMIIYTTNPNGAADQFTPNDTLKTSFYVVNTVNAPLVEGFEGNTFPPDKFLLRNTDNNLTWEKSINVAYTGQASSVIKNFVYPFENTVDYLATPKVAIANADSAFVSFDYAYAPGKNYPGSTALPLDTLEVAITKDCGNSLTSIWKKWGEALQTVNNPNYPNAVEFIPTQENQWKHVRITIPSYVVNADDQFQVFFSAKSNRQNDIYIDNINVFSKTLPQRLKDQGYLIYPNPFSNSFLIHHYTAPVNLQQVQVYNSVGELVWEKRFAGNATTEIMINLNKLAKGVYILKMTYLNKKVVEKIVKN